MGNLPSPLHAELQFLNGDLLERAITVTSELYATASERDRTGGTAKPERDLLRKSGLLVAWISKEFGGHGAAWPEVLDSVRLLARVDSSLAHVYGFQHLLLATSQLFGTAQQSRALHQSTVENHWFWGNALNPLDPGTSLRAVGAGFVLNGKKSFSSGSVDADFLIVSAVDQSTHKLVVAALPAARSGIHVLGDWDNFGQRQTDSGSVEFHDVNVLPSEILAHPGPLGSVFASLRPVIAQLTLANVYLGIAEGAVYEARKYTQSSRRAWPASGVQTASQDSYVLRHYGDFHVSIAAARALADVAAEALQAAYALGDALSEEQRGLAAVRTATAKVAATQAALTVTAGIFEVAGARATSARLNLDRFWRNARTHTLHDPVDYKLRELGEFALLEQLPKPSFYS